MTAPALQSLGHCREAVSASADASAGFLARQLVRSVSEASAEELPALVGALAQAQAVALARLTARTSEDRPAANDRLLTMPEVAERLGTTEHQAREMGRRGELPTVTVGDRFVRVRTGALEDWIRRRENGRTIRREGGR